MESRAKQPDLSSPAARAVTLAAAAVLTVTGCSEKRAEDGGGKDAGGYVIGLGEIMGLNQMRHAKLWFAGEAGNWPLAAYEIDELREGFADAARFHNHHKDVPEPLSRMIPQYVDAPLARLDNAVRRGDRADFERAFDSLTAGCNACHEAAGFGFNVVKRPTAPPFTNQSFEPAGAGRPAAP